jgi:threonine dehydrogenase-like Zn-dependent dehydrogenase
MLGVWLENKKITLRDNLPLPNPEKDEVLVEIFMSGICNTDLELMKGYYPYTGILGHEFVGVVRSSASKLYGKRVVGEINAACMVCTMCKKEMPSHCKNRRVLGIVNKPGCFSEFITLPSDNLIEVPTNISDEEATFTEPLAAALQIQQQINIKPRILNAAQYFYRPGKRRFCAKGLDGHYLVRNFLE